MRPRFCGCSFPGRTSSRRGPRGRRRSRPSRACRAIGRPRRRRRSSGRGRGGGGRFFEIALGAADPAVAEVAELHDRDACFAREALDGVSLAGADGAAEGEVAHGHGAEVVFAPEGDVRAEPLLQRGLTLEVVEGAGGFEELDEAVAFGFDDAFLIAARSAWRRAGLRGVFLRLMRRRRPLSVMPVSCSPRASVWPENSPRIFASVPRRASAISLASGSGTCTSEASGLRARSGWRSLRFSVTGRGGYGLAAEGFLAGPAAHEEGERVVVVVQRVWQRGATRCAEWIRTATCGHFWPRDTEVGHVAEVMGDGLDGAARRRSGLHRLPRRRAIAEKIVPPFGTRRPLPRS